MELMLAIIAVELYLVMSFLWGIRNALKDIVTQTKHNGADMMRIMDELHMLKLTTKIIAGEVIKKEDGPWKEKN